MTDQPRRLIAIMFTDIVGYSAMTQRDEAMTLSLLDEHNRIVRAALAAHAGREVKTVGDAFLVAFESALDAVRCAIRIQADLKSRNATGGTPIELRIGIHLGDVVYREGDVFGDGVNIAARVQSQAGPGEIRMSEDVARQVTNKIEYRLRDLGLAQLKNIDQPMRLFAVAGLLSEPDTQPANAARTAAAAAPGQGRVARLLQRPRWMLAAGGAVVVAVLGLATVFGVQRFARATEIGSVAVLPFENASGDADMDYLSDGISASLINKLSGLNGIRVTSRTSAFRYKGKKIDPLEVGRTLGVDALILGTLAQRGASLTITSELVRVSNAAQVWGEKYNRQLDDLLKVEGEIATTIAQTLRRQLSTQEQARLAHTATTDPEAYRLYLKGRSYTSGSQQQMDQGIELLQQAVARAPDYALAHAGLASVHTRQAFLRGSSRAEALGKARDSANRALELDPDLPEAHVALGLIRFFFEWDWAGAEAEFRRALELNPGNGSAQEDYGPFLTAMGRLDEGLHWSQMAFRADPLSVSTLHDVAINTWIRGDFEKTTAGFRRAIEVDPNWTWGYIKLARVLAVQNKCKEALVQAEVGEKRIAGGAAPLARSWLGATYATCGDAKRAREKLAELRALEKQQYVDPVTFATIHGPLGEVEEAVRWYEKAYEDRTPNMVWAASMAKFDPAIAAHPRYLAIVERMRFPKIGK